LEINLTQRSIERKKEDLTMPNINTDTLLESKLLRLQKVRAQWVNAVNLMKARLNAHPMSSPNWTPLPPRHPTPQQERDLASLKAGEDQIDILQQMISKLEHERTKVTCLSSASHPQNAPTTPR
jgi:hypothetical protein